MRAPWNVALLLLLPCAAGASSYNDLEQIPTIHLGRTQEVDRVQERAARFTGFGERFDWDFLQRMGGEYRGVILPAAQPDQFVFWRRGPGGTFDFAGQLAIDRRLSDAGAMQSLNEQLAYRDVNQVQPDIRIRTNDPAALTVALKENHLIPNFGQGTLTSPFDDGEHSSFRGTVGAGTAPDRYDLGRGLNYFHTERGRVTLTEYPLPGTQGPRRSFAVVDGMLQATPSTLATASIPEP